MVVLTGTLRALIAPRRSIPLGMVVTSVAAVEAWASRSARAVMLDLVLFAAFCLVVPAAWRLLCSGARSSSIGALAAYAVLSCALVALLGVALPTALKLPFTYVIEPSSVALLMVLFMVGGWGLGRDIELEQGVAAERGRAERAQLLALRTHLDPHFLFNTLNAIAEWCHQDPGVAETATLGLASMLRSILDGIREPSWKLATELELIEKLFELYRVRDSERYRFSLELRAPLPVTDVPPMILLPLVENAITHGPSAGHQGAVRLRVGTTEEAVTVELRNPGRFTGRRAGGQGLEIVERRLELAYRGRARLSVTPLANETVTELVLPVHPEEFG